VWPLPPSHNVTPSALVWLLGGATCTARLATHTLVARRVREPGALGALRNLLSRLRRRLLVGDERVVEARGRDRRRCRDDGGDRNKHSSSTHFSKIGLLAHDGRYDHTAKTASGTFNGDASQRGGRTSTREAAVEFEATRERARLDSASLRLSPPSSFCRQRPLRLAIDRSGLPQTWTDYKQSSTHKHWRAVRLVLLI
jgi:hypothetical protein